jgi:SAM-dependent methyltransferase
MGRAVWQAMAMTLAAASLVAAAAPIRPSQPGTRRLLHASDQQTAQAKPRPRLFKAQDLGLLESPDRVEWQKPEQIMDTLRIAEGSVVADLGAGSGWFTIQLARRVGPNGIVYAEDIQPQMVDYIEQRAQRENLRSVRPILGTATDPLLPPGVDAILIDDVFHELDDPVTFFRNASKSLKPGGRLGVVDFLPGGGGPGPAPEERPDPQAVTTAAEAAGLYLQKREDIPPFLFLLVFERR